MGNGVHYIDGKLVPICMVDAVFSFVWCEQVENDPLYGMEVRVLSRPMLHSVLIVSASERDTEGIRGLLLESGFTKTSVAADTVTARERCALQQYDMVIISAPIQGESGVQLARDLTKQGFAGVLLLVKNEFYEEAFRLVERYGILLLPKPVSRTMFVQSLRLMAAMRNRMRGVENKARSLETKMNELKMVERAKWVLVEYLKMSEAEAHRYIEKQAMDRRTTRGEIAEGILKTYEN